jgi:hypothetical protein
MDNEELQANNTPGSVKVEHVSFQYGGPIIQHTQVCVGNDCYGWAPAGDLSWEGVGLNSDPKFSYEMRETERGAWVSDSYTIPNTTPQDVLTALKNLGEDLIEDGLRYSINNQGNAINCHGFASIAKDQLPARAQQETSLRMRNAKVNENGEIELADTMSPEQLAQLQEEVKEIFAKLEQQGVVMSVDDNAISVSSPTTGYNQELALNNDIERG